MYDIVFLSYQEPNADGHWGIFRRRFPRAMRVDGIEGIVAAHQAAANLCRTRYFWVVDGDNIVNDDFDFKFQWDRRDHLKDRVAVWRALNNVTGQIYGYGGVKLLPRRPVLNVAPTVADFTTSISEHFHPIDEVASTTIINATAFDAWKAGFRECTKLASGIIRGGNEEENRERLAGWKEDHDGAYFGEYVSIGAREGERYGTVHAHDPGALAMINNWEWLRERFDNAGRD